MISWEKPSATDNSGNVSNVFCDPPSGTNFTIGKTVVTCKAEDGSGNEAVCYFDVNVKGEGAITIYSRRGKVLFIHFSDSSLISVMNFEVLPSH